jgi:hypothetical protein
MNNTSAVLIISHALWPGPATATCDATPSTRAPLLTYASKSATRCSKVGTGSSAAPSRATPKPITATASSR